MKKKGIIGNKIKPNKLQINSLTEITDNKNAISIEKQRAIKIKIEKISSKYIILNFGNFVYFWCVCVINIANFC